MRRYSTFFKRAALGLATVGFGFSGGNAPAGDHRPQVYVLQPNVGLGAAAPVQTVGVLGVAPARGLFHHHQQFIVVGAPAQAVGMSFGVAPSFGMGMTTTPSFGSGCTQQNGMGMGLGSGMSSMGLGSTVLGAGAGSSLTNAERNVAIQLGGSPQAISATQRLKAHIGDLLDDQQQGRLGAGLNGSALIQTLIKGAISFVSKEFLPGVDLSPIISNVESLVRDVIQERIVDNSTKTPAVATEEEPPAPSTSTKGSRKIPVQARGYLVIDQIYFNGKVITTDDQNPVITEPTKIEQPSTGDIPGEVPAIVKPLGSLNRRSNTRQR